MNFKFRYLDMSLEDQMRYVRDLHFMGECLYKVYVTKKMSKKSFIEHVKSLQDPIPELTQWSDTMVQELDRSNNKKLGDWFVTINWDNSLIQLEDMKCVLGKVFSKKWLLDAKIYYTYEQRGESMDNIRGIHNHILIKGIIQDKSHIHKEIFNTVKKYVGNKKHVDVQKLQDGWADDRLEYMRGNKWDEDKKLKCETDKLFRDKNSLQSIYEIN